MTGNDLKLRARALRRPNRVEQELDEELAFHLERETRKLIDDGMAPTAARQRAQAHFGSTALAADRCRDERGTAVLDDTIRDVQYAWRSFAKAPLAAFTIVVTVALGLGLVAVVFTVLNTLVFRVDQVPDIGQMYTVERTQLATGEGAPLTRPMFDAMRTDTHVFTDAYATVPDIDLDVDGRRVAVTLVTGNFFQVVRVSPIIGRALMPADDAAAGGNAVVVLSHKGWERHHPAAAGSHRGLRAALPRLRIDPVAYLASLGLIVAACLLAAWLPAARAAKVDPMHTLRQA